jgi:nitrile hydratase
MDGVHDLGGMHGFGRAVAPGWHEPYHERWEARVFGLHLLIGIEGLEAPPGGRAIREEMDPVRYLEASYYERWLWGAQRLLERGGAIRPGEVDETAQRLAAGEPVPSRRARPARAGQAARAVASLHEIHPIQPVTRARFGPGDQVRVRRMRPAGHTRCPRYARGATGTVERVHGAGPLPDSAVYRTPAPPEPIYSVAFGSERLWGASDEPPWTVMLDLWESYLEPAP